MKAPRAVKRRRLTIHGQEVTEQDWRGILAVLTTAGYFLIVAISVSRSQFTETMATLGILSTLETLVLNWYFKSKEEVR